MTRTLGIVRGMRHLLAAMLLIAATTVVGPAYAEHQDEAASDTSEEELAKKTQNPVADLISVPFQNNFNFNTGPREKTAYVLNVQPVIPINVTEDWNLITRVIT